TMRVAAITAAGLDILDGSRGSQPSDAGDDHSHERLALQHRLTAKQREALELLAGTPTGIATPSLAARGIAADAISRLARHGYISLRHDRVERDPWIGATHVPGTSVARDSHVPRTEAGLDRQLTREQATALERLRTLADT